MTTCQLCGRETDNSAFCSTCEPRASRVADVDSQAVPRFRCTICGRIGTVGRCCGRDTREPLNKLARAELDSQASQLSKIVGSFPDLPTDFTERDSQAAAIAGLVASLTARLAAKGDMYQPDREWQTLATVRSALVDAQRLLAELEGEK